MLWEFPSGKHSIEAVSPLPLLSSILLQITGDTIFNAAKFGDLDVDDSDRPLDPPKIISVEVRELQAATSTVQQQPRKNKVYYEGFGDKRSWHRQCTAW